jgi:hypothetical protein
VSGTLALDPFCATAGTITVANTISANPADTQARISHLPAVLTRGVSFTPRTIMIAKIALSFNGTGQLKTSILHRGLHHAVAGQ